MITRNLSRILAPKSFVYKVTPLVRKVEMNAKHNIRIQYLSDVHLEENEEPCIEKKADYLALCGDIGNPFDQDFETFLTKMCKSYKDVFFVPGNHEYFFASMSATNLRLMMHAGDISNLHFLNNTYYDITDKLRIVGAPLWSNVDDMTAMGISDFSNIRMTLDNFITPKYYRILHKTSVEFIMDQISEAKKTNKELIVVSHHAPLLDMLGKYRNTFNSNAYATDLSHLFEYPLIAWISGHTHQNMSVEKNGVRCVSNCHGIGDEVVHFKSDVYIDV